MVNEKALKYTIKATVKHGLVVGRTEQGMIYMGGDHWGVQLTTEDCSNNIKGELVKLIGDLPEPGKFVRVWSTGTIEELQRHDEMPLDLTEWLKSGLKACHAIKCDIYSGAPNNLYIPIDTDEGVMFADRQRWLIACGTVDEQSESPVQGPAMAYRDGATLQPVIWYNDTGVVWLDCRPAEDGPERIIARALKTCPQEP